MLKFKKNVVVVDPWLYHIAGSTFFDVNTKGIPDSIKQSPANGHLFFFQKKKTRFRFSSVELLLISRESCC